MAASSKLGPNPPKIIKRPLHSVVEFITAFSDFSSTQSGLKCFRGQRKSSWDEVPGLLRPDMKALEEREKQAVRDLISTHPSEFSSDETMFDRLVRMQHFGLPTRLMDVSLNPLIALYFASDPGPDGEDSDGVVTAFAVPEGREKYYDSDSVSCIANLANLAKAEKNEIIRLRGSRKLGTTVKERTQEFNKEEVVKRLHQFIRAEKPYFLPIINPIDLFKPYYVHPKMSNRRIVAQSGAFIIYGLTPPQTIGFAHKILSKRFIVPKEYKASIRSSLADLGINESTLYPEIDRAAKAIKEQYRQP